MGFRANPLNPPLDSPREMRKLSVGEWIVWLVQRMYTNVQSHVCVGKGYSQEIEVKVEGPPGLCTQSLALHYYSGGLVT